MQDWYPSASRSQTYPTDGRVYASGYAWKLVLHSTEGTSWPSYSNNAPHFTINPRSGDVRQHYPLSYPAKALRQPDTPPTNKGRAVQIEIIGTCDPSREQSSKWAGWFLPGYRPEDFQGLTNLITWIASQTGIALTSGVLFRPYPSSYGAPTGRLSSSAWKSYSAVCGHQHVPGNDHGDPGDIDITGILQLAQGGAAPPPQRKEIDMFYGNSPDGKGWLCNGVRKTWINNPATRDVILKTGVPNIGGQSSDFWNEFPTDEGVISTINTIAAQTKKE